MRKKKKAIRKIAKERIKKLLNNIKQNKCLILAINSAKLIRKICLKYNIRLKKDEKIFCKKCFMPLIKAKKRSKEIKKYRKKYLQINYYCKCGNIIKKSYEKSTYSLGKAKTK